MPSLYKVIKNNSVVSQGEKDINTEYKAKNKKVLSEKNAKDFIDNYEVLARTMLENSRRQSDDILSSTYGEVKKIEEEAYKKGYAKGEKEGYELGVEKGNKYYEQMKNKANKEVEILNKNAETLLQDTKSKYVEYLQEKQEDIKNLIVSSIESILKKEMKNEDAISNMILDALESAEKSKTIIVKARSEYVEDIKTKIEAWKNQLVFKEEIFVVPDDNLQEGTSVIQMEKGKIVVDANKAFEKVKEIIGSINNE